MEMHYAIDRHWRIPALAHDDYAVRRRNSRQELVGANIW